jgi:prepilin-type N-terminal cleavage/methylation domain-containing protein
MRIQSKKWLTSDLRPLSSARGFTLLELLIVISLIVVLMGLLLPAFSKVKNGAKDKKRNIEIRVIESAIQAYKLQEKHFSAPEEDLSPPSVDAKDYYYGEEQTNDCVYGGDNSVVMTLLREAVPPVLDVNKLRWDGDDNVIDPYDNPYKITLDLNYDGKIGGTYIEYKVE